MDLCRTCIQDGFCTYRCRLERPVQACPLYLGEVAAGYVNEWMDPRRTGASQPIEGGDRMNGAPRQGCPERPQSYPKGAGAEP